MRYIRIGVVRVLHSINAMKLSIIILPQHIAKILRNKSIFIGQRLVFNKNSKE